MTPIPVIDSHIHLFDPNRPEGAPYRGPASERFYTDGAFPQDYRALAAAHAVAGAIAVEASPWPDDNRWLLDTAASSDTILGIVGNLQPDAPDFADSIALYADDPLFLGIRYGDLWDYDLAGRGDTPTFVAGAKLMAEADLVLDSANPSLALLQAIVRLSDRVPDLRIVIDHLPHFTPKPDEAAKYRAVLGEIAERPLVSVKLSEVIHPIDGVIRTDIAAYRDRLDLLFATFGEDRVLFGSDWPNSLMDAPLDDAFAIMRGYFAGRTLAEKEKFFWRNSLRIYRWRPRNGAQQELAARA